MFGRLTSKFLSSSLAVTLAAFGIVAMPQVSEPAEAITSTAQENVFDYYAHLDGASAFKAADGKQVIPDTTGYTVEAWIHPGPIGADGENQAIYSQNQDGSGSDNDRTYVGLQTIGGIYQIHVGYGANDSDPASFNIYPGDGIQPNAWSHIAVSVDSSETYVYLNGQLIGRTGRAHGAKANAAPFVIGATGGDSRYFFRGGIDQVKVWDAALSGAEVATSMHAWSDEGITGKNITHHFDFNDLSAQAGKVFDKADATLTGAHLSMIGAPLFKDVKSVKELSATQVFTFPRSYLTEVGGWKVPEGATTFDALVAGAGGGGGADGGGGGAGGEINQSQGQSFASSQFVRILVGQGGVGGLWPDDDNSEVPPQNTRSVPSSSAGYPGQTSSVSTVAASPSVLLSAVGGGAGPGWNAGTVAAGGTGGVGGVRTPGQPGGQGPSSAALAEGAIAWGTAGSDGIVADLTGEVYGSSGSGGLLLTDATPATARPSANRSGTRAGVGSYLYDTGKATTGFSAEANSGAGGSGAAAGGSTTGNFYYTRTSGGHGGSGIVVISVSFTAKCLYGTSGFTTAQLPKVRFMGLSNFTSADKNIVTDNTSAAAFYGEPAIINGKLYTPDRGRGQLRRMDLDGSNIESVGALRGPGLGVATDDRYVYAWSSSGIARFDTQTDEYIPVFIAKGDIAKVDGELAFGRFFGVGYLFLTSGRENYSGFQYSKVYAVPVTGANVPAQISDATHLFSESKLEGGTTTRVGASGVAVVGNDIFWSTFTYSGTEGGIWKKTVTGSTLAGSNLPGGSAKTDFADSKPRTEIGIRVITGDASKVYYHDRSGRIYSINGATGASRLSENSPGLILGTSTGLTAVGECTLPPSSVGVAVASDGSVSVSWTSRFSSGATHLIEYRVNGGAWVSAGTSTGTSKDLGILNPAPAGDLEVRVATRAFNQLSQFTYATPVFFDPPAEPVSLCASPMKLQYKVPANATVGLTLTLPAGNTTKSVQIDWGDGTVDPTQIFSGRFKFSHTYAAAGEYVVDVCGDISGIYNNATPQTYLTAVLQWGAALTSLVDLSTAFYGAQIFTDVPNTFPPNVTSAQFMFYGAKLFNDPDVSNWGSATSNVRTMGNMFNGASSFNQNVGSWNTSNVTDLGGMFSGALAFNNGGSDSIKDWDTSKVTSLWSTFYNTQVFNQPLNWDVSKVRTFVYTFGNNYAFNQDISGWVTSSATRMDSMFNGARVFNQNIGGWTTTNVTTFANMFSGAAAFNQNIGSWNTSSATNMSSMFSGATAFNNGGQNFTASWVTSQVTNMSFMFNNATSFNQPIAWDTSKVTSMRNMFYNAKAFNSVPDIEIDALVDALNMVSLSGMSDDNYGTFVIDLKNQHVASGALNNVSFGAVDKTAFCSDPNAAVRYLVDTAGWTVTDKTNKTTASFCTPSVTITAANGTHVYGDPVPSVGYTMTVTNGPLPTSDWLSEIVCAPKTADNGTVLVSKQAVGSSYVTECSGPSGTGLGIAVTYVDGTYSVTKRPITVQAKNAVSVTGKPKLTWGDRSSASGDAADYMITAGTIASGDTLTFTLSNSASFDGSGNYSTAGTTAIKIDPKATAPTNNYEVTLVDGTLTISPETYVFTAKSKVKTYGDVATFDSVSGFVCETNSGTSCATELDGKSVSMSSTGAGSSANVGSYPISISVAPNPTAPTTYDYINTDGGVLQVVKRKLTVTPIAKTVQFGATAPTYTFTITGFASGESVADLPADYAPTCSSGYNDTTPRGTVLTITCSGGNAGSNYEYVYATGDLTVPAESELVDLTVRSLTVEDETADSMTATFSFNLTPVNQICFATLSIFIPEDEPITDRVQVTPGAAVEFEMPLYVGEYDYTLEVDGNCAVSPTIQTLSIGQFVAPVLSGGGSYVGPVMSDFSTRTVDICDPTEVSITGNRLAGVTASVSGVAVKVLENTDSLLRIQIPAGLTPAEKVDLVVNSPLGKLTVQGVFEIPQKTCAAQVSKGEWTKRLANNTIKFYSKSPIGEGKIQFFVNGREIAWLRAVDETDPKLSFASGYPYFVRSYALKPGKNRMEIRIDGVRVWRATYVPKD